MNIFLRTRIKRVIAPTLDVSAGTGHLSNYESKLVHALLQVLLGETDVPDDVCRRICARTQKEPGLLKEYQRGFVLLARHTERLFTDRKFWELTLEERDRVLRSFLKPYPHEEFEPRWRRNLRLTSENQDIVTAKRGSRRFREFVARGLLETYFQSAAGWALVGYPDFPGHARLENESCEVVSTRVEGPDIWLELSDSTIERMDPKQLKIDDASGLAVVTKSGRQRVTFSRGAYYEFAELLEETEEGFLLTVGDTVHTVLREHAQG